MVAALFGNRDVPTESGSALPTPLIDLAPVAQRQALPNSAPCALARSSSASRKVDTPYCKRAKWGSDQQASLWILTIKVAGETGWHAIPAHAPEAVRT